MHHDRVHETKRDIPTLRLIGAFFAFLSGLIWIYTLVNSGLPLTQLFIPSSIGTGGDWALTIRSAMQWDQILVFSAAFFWLALSYFDLKRAGMLEVGWITLIGTATLLGLSLGPGTAFILSWLYREEILATKRHKGALTTEKLTKSKTHLNETKANDFAYTESKANGKTH